MQLSDYGISWENNELTTEPSPKNERTLARRGPIKLEVLKNCKATGKITQNANRP